MSARPRPSGVVYALGALCIAAIVVAFLVVGPESGSATVQSRTITARQGVVQSTVSGSGNIQAATQLNLGFKTAGVVQHIYVSEGQHVTAGELLAELQPQSAEVSLEQARATLRSSEAALTQLEESEGETSTAQGASGSSAHGASATAASASAATHTTTAPATTTPAGTAPASTTPASSPSSGTAPSGSTHQTGAGTHAGSGSSAGSGEASTTPASSEKPKQSAATREANLASARAAVSSDKLAVESAEQALADTRLYAPTSGTLVSLNGEVGEAVSASGTTKASPSSSSSSSSSSSTGAGAGAARGGSGASSSSGSSGSSGASSAFAVLSDLSSLQVVVPLSESEVTRVRVGQPATVAIEALEGAKVAAHVSEVASLATSNSGVVSYDVTFQLDQSASGVKPGMSATAEVVVAQQEGVNVPTRAITAGTVTVVHEGRRTPRRVVTGLAGDSSTIIVRGLNAGEQVLLPVAASGGTTSLLSRLAGRGGGLGGGLGGGAGGGLGGGGAFRAPGGGG
jgi:multidrug efflux pump subunit AcrA (membrane-fusion protein)